MSNNIKGKIVVITGASSGLGEAAARHLSVQGAAVVLGARRADRIEALSGELTGGGGQALAVRAISEALRQEGTDYNIRSTIISPGAINTELPASVGAEGVAESIASYYDGYAIPADSFARCVAFAISQPEEVDVNEILFRPTRQQL